MSYTERSDRFEMIAACDGATLEALADDVLGTGPSLRVLQEPRPQLVMEQVVEPVEGRPFNLGEVLVTAAEVELDGERGFAMVAGKAEAVALGGAIVDAAVQADHEMANWIGVTLEAAAAEADERRRERWAESRNTTVEFESMEGEL